MKELRFPPPFPKQREFLLARERFVAYGGSRGGGKSYAVRLKAALAALYYPGIRILILRRSYPELYENHIKEMRRMLRSVATWRDSEKTLRLPNGAEIRFGYCDTDADAERYQGQEYDLIFMDEATHFSEYAFRCLSACLRGVNDHPHRMYLTCNPGGVGHAWVKRLFIDRDYESGERAEDYRFIPATVYDNAPLMRADPSYLDRLTALPSDLRRAWLEGDWDLSAGQYFSEFRRSVHVISPAALPENCRFYRAFDYGLDMLACLWFALDPAGNVTVIRELAVPDLVVSRAAQAILAATEENILETYAPPDLGNRQKDTGKSMWELFEENGLRLTVADRNRVQGWMQVKEFLTPRPLPDGSTAPRLRIFESCPGLIRSLAGLRHDEKNPDDCAREPHELTHLPDALRYFLRSRPSPLPPARKKPSRMEEYFRTHRRTAAYGRFN